MPKPAAKTAVVGFKCGARKCKASRPVILVNSGDRVRFHNRTPDWIHIQFADDNLFLTRPFKLAAGKTKTLKVRRALRGIYPYAVFCTHHSRFCVGFSMPIIIVPR